MAEESIELTQKEELSGPTEPTRAGPVFVPRVDIFEDASGITVVADVPGASNEGIDIDLEQRTLTINATVNDELGADETYLAREWTSGSFHRQFTVSERIDRDHIQASLAHGVLRVHLPKVEESKPRKIPIGTN